MADFYNLHVLSVLHYKMNEGAGHLGVWLHTVSVTALIWEYSCTQCVCGQHQLGVQLHTVCMPIFTPDGRSGTPEHCFE